MELEHLPVTMTYLHSSFESTREKRERPLDRHGGKNIYFKLNLKVHLVEQFQIPRTLDDSIDDFEEIEDNKPLPTNLAMSLFELDKTLSKRSDTKRLFIAAF